MRLSEQARTVLLFAAGALAIAIALGVALGGCPQ
jgi:hypothetical protein